MHDEARRDMEDRFEEFSTALREVLDRYDDIADHVDVLVHPREGPNKVATLGALASKCDPPCGSRKCVFNPRNREWTCWPP